MENHLSPPGDRCRYPAKTEFSAREMTERNNVEQSLNAASFKPMILTSLGFAVFVFTFYSINGISAFGLGEPDSMQLEGRPEFTGREFVPGFGGMLGSFLALMGMRDAFKVLRYRCNLAMWLAVGIGVAAFLFVACQLMTVWA